MKLTERIVSSVGQHPKGAAPSVLMETLRKESAISKNSFHSILNRLTREGKVRKTNGLLYPADSFKPYFRTNPDKVTSELFKNIKAALPFTQISIWNTDTILPLMHNIPNFSLTVVGAERLAVDSVVGVLENQTDSLVFRDSEKNILSRFASGHSLIVVTPQVSQAPVEEEDGILCPTLEKILVDILCDNALHSFTGSEAYAIYATALGRYKINRKTLLRYAGRRNRTAEVNAILKEIEK